MVNSSIDPTTIKILFREKKQFFGLVYEFNLLPAEYIHNTWINSFIPSPVFRQLTTSKRGLAKLSELILVQSNLDQDFYYDFSDPALRLALLPCELLNKLALYCGAALNHGNIMAVIDRRRKEKMIESIGCEEYLFAVKTAPLLLGKHHIFYNSQLEQEDFKVYFERCGVLYLLSGFIHMPKSLFTRFLFKFPKEITQNQDLFNVNQEVDNWWLFLKRILRHAIDPQWHHLFT